MPEEIEIDTEDMQETLKELHEERAEREEEQKHTAWTRFIALSTAMMAVIAAVAALQSGSKVNEALILKQQASIEQAHASDTWAHFQAKGIKGVTNTVGAEVLRQIGKGDHAAKLDDEAKRYAKDQAKIMAEAKSDEDKRDKANKESEEKFHEHHHFALVVTITQVAIALSAISALLRQRPVWYASLVLGFIGLVLFVYALIPVAHGVPGAEH